MFLDTPHTPPRACIARPVPTQAPPPAPVANLKGFWRVGGYTAQIGEILVYHPHTHTPITKPHARRFEPAKRPFADSSSTSNSSEMRRIQTDACVRYGAHAVKQPGNPNRPNTQAQPPGPRTCTQRVRRAMASGWNFSLAHAARDDDASPTNDAIDTKKCRRPETQPPLSVALPCPPTRNR